MKGFIRRLLARLGATAQVVKEQVVDPLTMPLFERVRYTYTHLDTVAFADYTRRGGERWVVKVVHPTIEACVNDLLSHIRNLENSGYIPTARVQYQAKEQSINRFFLTNEGNYIPLLQNAVQELVDAVVGLCDAIDEAKHVEHDTKSYNLRMLNSLLHILLDLGLTLTEISQEIRQSR